MTRPDILATYHYNQYVVAVTHLFTLGFICSIVMGAMYQLVPVALETRLYSEKLAKWQFVFHVVGFTGMVWKFWVWDMTAVGHYGSVMAVGAGLFVYNIARTLWQVPKWNVVAGGVASALAWFSLTILAGLYLVAAKCWNFSPFDPMAQMHAHAHLGGIGFFLMMIVSVSYKLLPMFALSQLQDERRAWWSIWLLNGGLAGLFPTLLLKSAWKLGFALVVITGLCAGDHRHPESAETASARLGAPVLSHGLGGAGSSVGVGSHSLLAAPAGHPAHDPARERVWFPGPDRGRGVDHHRVSLQDRPIPRLVPHLRPRRRPEQGALVGRPVLGPVAGGGLLALSDRPGRHVRKRRAGAGYRGTRE